MNPSDEIKRLIEILDDWAPLGPADYGQYFEAKENLRQIELHSQTYPLSPYATGKRAILEEELNDLFFRQGKRRKMVASFASILSAARFHAIVIDDSLRKCAASKENGFEPT